MTTTASPTEKRHWTWLPSDVLASILPYLVTSQDYVRFSVVCKQWHSAAKDEIQNHMATRKQIPFLLVHTKDMWSIYNVAQDRLLDSKLEVPHNGRICGSSHGWLILVGANQGTVMLFNPFTRAHISLPLITTYQSIALNYVNKAILSADPSLYPNDYIFAAGFNHARGFVLDLIRPGRGDGRWRTFTRSDGHVEDMIFDRSGKWVYVATGYFGMVLRADLEGGEVLETVVEPCTYAYIRYLGETSSDDLLVFSNFFDGKVEVGKLQGSSFVKVDDLVGDTTAFIGRYSPTTLVGRGFQGVETDCVYYCDLDSYGIPKFNLKYRRFDRHSVTDYLPCKPIYDSFSIWILPSVNL